MSHLYLLAGSNGAGKTTLYERVIGPTTGLPFVNADKIASALAGGEPITEALSLEAAQLAAQRRSDLIDQGRSFVAETVFSHPSKVDLVRSARARGYAVHLHVVVVPEDLTVARVRTRVANGGHDVPEMRVRARYGRLWRLVAEAITLADDATVYDNSRLRTPFQVLARYTDGRGQVSPSASWPRWVPPELHPDNVCH